MVLSKLCRVKVIGMTEPEQNDSGYHAISDVKKPINHWEVQKDNKFTNFDMTELLQHLDPLYEISAQVTTKYFYINSLNIKT